VCEIPSLTPIEKYWLNVLESKVYIYSYTSKSNRNWYHDDWALEDLRQTEEGDICIKNVNCKSRKKDTTQDWGTRKSTILKYITKVWSGFIWLRIGSSRSSCKDSTAFRFNKRQGIFLTCWDSHLSSTCFSELAVKH
jgi:hypothetical protein